MDSLMLITILIVIGALTFDFINGFHDSANAIATSISTKALSPKRAITLAVIMNFLGAISFTGVAQTITKNIVDPFSLEDGSAVILSALIAGILWNLLTWYMGIPSSSSHTIIGSIAGAAAASSGFHVLKWAGFMTIIEALILSPIIAFCLGYLVYSIFKIVFKNRNLPKTNRRFRHIQIFTAALQSFTHGTNDAQKTMGIITMALMANGYIHESQIPFWVQVACAIAMGLGTSVGGWKIIRTVGGKIMKIRPINGVAADVTGAGIIFGASALGLPVSTTHVISTSIMGVGAAHRVRGVNWDTAKHMVVTWVITLPLSAALAAVIFYVLRLFL
ncbi:inorganic phosphate transporter [Bacillus testis]|uniref:inorganic phosphate transporter n=1 Tax=Bacillus testis TaxID=1622072 RepID=UPI00067E743A|nr:inorganic phosphate transporter [Bacillus testis]